MNTKRTKRTKKKRECAVAMDIWPRRSEAESVGKRLQQFIEHQERLGVRVGKITITYTRPGKVWLKHQSGVGMETDEAKLATVIERFFKKEF